MSATCCPEKGSPCRNSLPRLQSVTIDVLDRSWLPRKPSLTDVLLAIRSEMLNPEPFAHVPEAPHGPGDYYVRL